MRSKIRGRRQRKTRPRPRRKPTSGRPSPRPKACPRGRRRQKSASHRPHQKSRCLRGPSDKAPRIRLPNQCRTPPNRPKLSLPSHRRPRRRPPRRNPRRLSAGSSRQPRCRKQALRPRSQPLRSLPRLHGLRCLQRGRRLHKARKSNGPGRSRFRRGLRRFLSGHNRSGRRRPLSPRFRNPWCNRSPNPCQLHLRPLRLRRPSPRPPRRRPASCPWHRFCPRSRLQSRSRRRQRPGKSLTKGARTPAPTRP